MNARTLFQRLIGATLLIASLFALSACGGGGGGTGSGITPGATAVAVAQASQSRKLRGFDVQVTPFVIPATANNQPALVEVTVTNGSLISSMTAWIGDDYDSATQVVATPSATNPNLWSINWPKQTAAESGLLLTFNLKSGDVAETGVTDFRFK